MASATMNIGSSKPMASSARDRQRQQDSHEGTERAGCTGLPEPDQKAGSRFGGDRQRSLLWAGLFRDVESWNVPTQISIVTA